ncbi:unnamed protein product, partial [Coregonus sp. 'balchen']
GQTAGSGSGGGDGQANPEYIAFVLVPIFLLLGLLGVLICHKRDTAVPQRPKMRPKKKQEKDLEMCAANSDALKAMINENSIDSDGLPVEHSGEGEAGSRGPTTDSNLPHPPVTPISPGSPPGAAKHTCNHLHTIGGTEGLKNRCNHKKWPLITHVSSKRRSQGVVTVLAVGRFRVTKCDKERPARERWTLLITDSNGSMPTSPTETEPPKSRTTSVTTGYYITCGSC